MTSIGRGMLRQCLRTGFSICSTSVATTGKRTSPASFDKTWFCLSCTDMHCSVAHVRLSRYPKSNPLWCSENSRSVLPRELAAWTWQCTSNCHTDVQWPRHPAAATPCGWYDYEELLCLRQSILCHFGSEQSATTLMEQCCSVCNGWWFRPWAVHLVSVASHSTCYVVLFIYF